MQMANDKVQLFEDQPIRTAWVEDEEEWYFSVVDVVQALTESADGRKYWNKLKQRLKEEGSQLVTNCHQLKMTAKDGKKRMTDVANTEQLLRIIQSIPLKQPESFEENRMVAIEGGEAAGEARLAVEKRTGKPVITNKNAAQLQDLVTGLIETINDKSDDQEGD